MNRLSIIYQDDDILVIDKPAGLVVDRSNTQTFETLEDILQKDFNIQLERGGIVHRLDKDTSGVILVAKTQEALENLQSQFKERITKKEYTTLVHGLINEKFIVEGSIGRNPLKREKFMVLDEAGSPRFGGEAGKEAKTEFEPIKNLQFSIINFQTIFNDLNKIQMRKLERMHYNLFTLLKCFPLTGRTHQIRVHLKHKGFPIVSDATYSGKKIFRLDKRWCPRMFLHAKKLGFFHPKTKEWVEFEVKLPEDLEKVLSNLAVSV